MRRFRRLVAVLALGTCCVWAQAVLDVRVTGPQGEAIPNAALTLKHSGMEWQGSTGADGSHRFLQLPAGEYELVATAPGYYRAEAEIVVKPRQPLSVEIQLMKLAKITEQVEVHSADVSLGETSNSRLLTHSELTSLPGFTVRDIPTLALYTFPGATMSHDNYVHVRGHEVSLSEFINGVSFLENPQQQFSPGFSPEAFETVNMVSGTFSAEYGNRFGGILDTTTRSGFDVKGHGSAAFGGGSFETSNGFFEYGGSHKQLGYYLSASGFTSDWYMNPPEPEQHFDFGFGMHGSGQLDYRFTHDTLRLYATGGGANFEQPNLEADQEVGRNSVRRLRSQTVIVDWAHTFSPATALTTSLYERSVDDRLAPTTDPITPFGDGQRDTLTYGLKSDLVHSWRKHIFKAGFDLTRIQDHERFLFDSREDPLPPEDPEPFLFRGSKVGGLASLYAQDHINLTANLTADVGLRWDQLNLTNTFAQVSPRFALAYHFPSSRTTLHFAYNRFFSPHPLEYFLLANFFGTSAPEAPDRVGTVKPYRQHYFEAGLYQELHPKVTFELNGFYHRGDTPFEYREISVTKLFLPINSARAVSYGVDMAVNFKQLEKLGISGRIQYAWQRTFFFGPLSGGFAVGEEIRPGQKFLPAFDEPHSGTASIYYNHRWHDFFAGWLIRYGSGTAARNGAMRLPSHATADLTSGLRVWRRENASVRLEFNLANLSDDRYAIAKESEETPIQFAPPRIVSGRIKFTF